MPSFPSRDQLPFAIAFFATAACADAPAAPRSPALPPLSAVVLHVQEAAGQPLPALVAHRIIGGASEQDFLDSARITVRSDGTWEQQGWLQRIRAGVRTGRSSAIDLGTWEAEPARYVFRAADGTVRFTLSAPPGDAIELPLLLPGADAVIVSLLGRTAPPASVVGDWRATDVAGHALPVTLFHTPEFFDGTRWVSSHVQVDSAFMTVLPTGGYRHRIYVTERHGEPYGPPTRDYLRITYADFGSWTRTGTSMAFESGWLQNHRIAGDAAALPTQRLVLFHGLSHGDEASAFGYARR